MDFVGTYFKQCKTSHQKVNNRLLTVTVSWRFAQVRHLTDVLSRKKTFVFFLLKLTCTADHSYIFSILSFTNTYEIFYIYLSTVRQLHVISVMGRFRQRDTECERKSARNWIMNATSGAQFAATPSVNSVFRSSPAVFTVSNLFLL